MFEALEDQIRIDDDKATPKRQRLVLWAAVAITSVVLYGGLYFAIQFFT